MPVRAYIQCTYCTCRANTIPYQPSQSELNPCTPHTSYVHLYLLFGVPEVSVYQQVWVHTRSRAISLVHTIPCTYIHTYTYLISSTHWQREIRSHAQAMHRSCTPCATRKQNTPDSSDGWTPAILWRSPLLNSLIIFTIVQQCTDSHSHSYMSRSNQISTFEVAA